MDRNVTIFFCRFLCLFAKPTTTKTTLFLIGCVSTGQILISVNSLAGRTYAKHVEIVFILKLLLEQKMCKNRCECVRLLDNNKTNGRFVCFRFSPIFAITSTHTHTHTCVKFIVWMLAIVIVHKRTHLPPPQRSGLHVLWGQPFSTKTTLGLEGQLWLELSGEDLHWEF